MNSLHILNFLVNWCKFHWLNILIEKKKCLIIVNESLRTKKSVYKGFSLQMESHFGYILSEKRKENRDES